MAAVRVLVVDDSVVVRRMVTDILREDPGIEVVGTAANGRIALARIEQLRPDLVTLDVEMPVLDGLGTLEELRPRHPRLPVVMFSTLTARGAEATMDALERGASDFVTKPSHAASVDEARAAVRAQLVPKIHARAAAAGARPPPPGRPPPPPPARAPAAAAAAAAAGAAGGRVDLLVLGASTGGPDALTELLTALPGDLPVPVLVTQHMPAVFTRYFAGRLDQKCALTVSEAEDGQPLLPGHVLVAPGGHHLQVGGAPHARVARLDQGPQENFCRPAVDVMFRSAAATHGRHVLGVVLTGMGADGAAGSLDVLLAGGRVLVQDEATSVVWGMPGAVVAAGAAQEVLPLAALAPAVLTRCRADRGTLAASAATTLTGRPA